ncbi:MAG: hypothetical protein JSR82_09065 [Verrucomicrobia bacterium]|nr:hypothetical protein [Verrucomicrobiota bacterium]
MTRFLAFLAACCLLAPRSAGAATVPADLLDDPHVREEMGVNDFTAPSIGKIIQELATLRPTVPANALDRERLQASFPNRFQLALHFGGLVADGLLLANAEASEGFQNLGRALLKNAQALGVDEELLRRSQSLRELAERRRWTELRRELTAAQRDVEGGLVRLRDEKIAHFIALGGWIRGLEATVAAVESDYSPERAAKLLRPDLLDYFISRLEETGLGTNRGTPLLQRVYQDLKSMHALLRGGLQQADVPRLKELATGLTTAIVTTKTQR